MRWLALGTAVLGVFIWRSGRVARHSILTKSAFPLGYYASGDFATSCSPIAPADDPAFNDLKYCEDETFWDVWNGQGSLQTRHLILSCDANRKAWNTVMGPLRDPEPRGSLWLNTLTSKEGQEDATPVRMVFQNYPEGHDFHPLGLEISPSHAGNTSNLFVVNHARQRTTIEHFSVDPSNPTIALYLRTLSTPYFVSPNSIALTSPTSFYVTNDHFFTRRLAWVGKFLPITESILALPLGWVAHVALIPNPLDPSGEPIFSHTVAALGIPFANGIALSPDGSTVAVASTTLGEVYFYQREPKDNTIKRIDSVPVPFTPDNIAFDDSGVLIVTGHPHFPSIVSVAANKTEVAPSWTVAVVPRSSSVLRSEYDTQAPISASLKAPAVMSYEVETLFQSNGTGFSTSSTALRDARSGRLYLTGLYAENGAIVCRPS
ncbi:hypothetical protein PC9H_009905 [Pleurotus ostreatus]|uniref:Calcium-dependent phosphotriesterase n=1 Tax=Pleurotus ostreatus TaxID=5322 RepID=A0A8H6ZQL0_PLEOS|nr:uncharacterized protein PC9H_009905 [Pleurotus ostreatus]KAF7424597.1 hypothetical protein PC9H_009905 [Pleurotus ostreatus]KAJ8692434.1 hypothetical protein PTI98_009746 [Pleurotus ostreatus]